MLLYYMYYKMWLREVNEESNIWRDITLLWVGRFNIVKMEILPKLIYTFITFPLKIPVAFYFSFFKVYFFTHLYTLRSQATCSPDWASYCTSWDSFSVFLTPVHVFRYVFRWRMPASVGYPGGQGQRQQEQQQILICPGGTVFLCSWDASLLVIIPPCLRT